MVKQPRPKPSPPKLPRPPRPRPPEPWEPAKVPEPREPPRPPKPYGALLFSLLGLLACGPSLEDAQAAWLRARPASYVFEYQRFCVCRGSGLWWRITVRQDSVADVQLLDSLGTDSRPDYSLRMSHPTLSQMFDGIAAFASQAHTWTRVRYDSHWHFPNRASGDATDRMGSHWKFEVRNFRPLQ